MESADSYSLPYFFWFKEKMYEVDGDTFAKVSNKFNEVRATHPSQYIITDNWTTETFEAFISACQLKPFDVNKNNAFELRELAIEWKVPTLLSFVENYIEENNLSPVDVPDYLGILLEHVEQECDNYEDWSNVAQDFDKALEDERFEQVPAEVIFQILAIADRKGVNQRQLIDFTMKMFKKSPAKAVPLMLRLDWSAMTQEEKDVIFSERLTHDQNISFFIASSLSAVDNKVEIDIRNMQKRREIEMSVMMNNIRRRREMEIKNRADQFKEETEKLLSDIERQERMINDLEDNVKLFRGKLESEERKVRAKRQPISDEALERITESVKEQVRETEENSEKEKLEFFAKMDRLALNSPRLAREYFANAAEKSQSEASRAQALLRELQNLVKDQDKATANSKKEANAILSMLCAKIVKDKFRYDSFLRRTNHRHKAFQRGEFWGASSAAVKASEEELSKIESQIDKLCPIRQSTAMSPVNSPKKRY